jgi:microcystin-dependent protein
MKTIHSYSIVPTLLAVLFGIQLSAFAASTPPERMTYQGFLVDGNGAALGLAAPENYDVIFRIYTDQTAGTLKWSEQQTVTVDKGYFSVLLGEGADAYSEARPALSSLFTGVDASERYIGITVKGIGAGDSDEDILPRLKLITSPYAFMATRASALVDSTGVDMITVTAGTGINVNGAVTATTINASTVTGNGTIPIGGIIMWSGSTATVPSGWALCNGQNGTPNLQDRFVVGAGSGYSVGALGGAAAVTLNAAQMPSHNHTVNPPNTPTASAGEHAHGYTSGWGDNHGISSGNHNSGEIGYVAVWQGTSEEGVHQHGVDIPQFNSGNNGSGSSHENRPPYYALAFIMRVQ